MLKLKTLCGVAIILLLAASCDHGLNNYNKESSSIPRPEQIASGDSEKAISKTEKNNTEDYDHIVDNPFLTAAQDPLSTFSIDVDPAAYSNIRRFINNGTMPPNGAVRIEEMVNYFDYHYTPPTNEDPFAVHTEIAACPWNNKHLLVQVGLKGKEIATTALPPANLVFLVDVSGSMDEPNKLPLVKASLKLLTGKLRAQDKVAIVVYAGAAGLVLPSTNGDEKKKIIEAIEGLGAGGSTAGAEGIKLAYQTAKANFIAKGNNRVILATDGDFNVGVSSDDELVTLIEAERKSNIFLTVLGYGMGNYKDNKMQQLADKGNGNHAYIDNINEAKKVLVKEFGSTLFTIAKDVKIQVEFNPAKVAAYRLIGYENRLLQKEDFNNDAKDAGELGAGHTVTALYEIIPAGIKDQFINSTDPLKYQVPKVVAENLTNEIMTVKLRYKEPTTEVSKLMVHTVTADNIITGAVSENFNLAAAVAAFGMLLRNSDYKQEASYEKVIAWAKTAKGNDEDGYRQEFINLVEMAEGLDKK